MLHRLFLLFFLLVIESEPKQIHAQNKNIDSLFILLHNDKEDTNKVNHLIALSGRYRNISNYDSALYYGNTALQLSQQLGYKKGIANSFNIIGIIYRQQDNYDKALKSHLSALKIREEIGNKFDIASSYNNIGLVLWNQGNHTQALENFFSALKIFNALLKQSQTIGANENSSVLREIKSGIASSYNNIGNVYYEQIKHKHTSDSIEKNYDEVLENYSASLKLKEEIGQTKNTPYANTLNNIALIYTELGKLSQQRGFITNADKYYEKAMEKHLASLKIREELGDQQGIAITYNNIGNFYITRNNYPLAITYLQTGLDLGKKTGAKILIMEAYQGLSIVNEKMKEWEGAYQYHQLYSQIRDSIFNETRSKQIAEMQVKYETEKQEKENEIKTLQINAQRNQLNNNRIILFALVFGILFISVISWLMITRNKIKQREKLKTALIKQQELRTKAIIEAQEKERKRIAQDLHDGIGHSVAGIIAKVEQFQNETTSLSDGAQKKIFHITSALDGAYKELRLLSHQMMPGAIKEAGLPAVISDLLEKTLSDTKLLYNFESTDIDNISENIAIGIYRVFQELLSNILKHAHANKIFVQLFRNQGYIILLVEDDGIGIEKNNNPELIKSGIGLINIESRAKAMNGVFLIEPGPVKGTVATVRVPIIQSAVESD